MKRLVEIRSYRLKPGMLDSFHAVVVDQAVPMLRRWGTEVVAFGPSPHEADCYFLARAYTGLDDLNARQNAFYGSDEWRAGPREAIVSRIETHLSTVVWMSAAAVDELRALNSLA